MQVLNAIFSQRCAKRLEGYYKIVYKGIKYTNKRMNLFAVFINV